MSLKEVISPVPDCPAGVGLLEVQWSLRRGADAAEASLGTVLEVVSCASLSGALVANSGSLILRKGLDITGKIRCVVWDVFD